MKKRIKTVTAALLVLALLLLTGCASGGFDNSNLLRPPKTSGDKAKIQEIIGQKAGGEYILKYPRSGSYRSAVIYEDLDGDKISEAIVFYRPSVNEETAHILIIKNFAGNWKEMGDYTSRNTDVDKVEIGDITGDGKKEVIVGWSNSSGGSCTMSVYVAGKRTTAELKIEDTFNQFLIADMTDEGKNSIMLFSLAEPNVDANAKMLQYNSDTKTIFTRSSVLMSNSANSYLNLNFGRATKKQTGIFIDTLSIGGQSETQFVFWDKSKAGLSNPLNEQKRNNEAINPTLRNSSDAICTDIDSDGLTEIPTLTLMPYNASENINLVAFKTTWNSYNTKKNTLDPVLETVSDMKNGYYFIIPDEWKDRITARGSRYSDSVTFYLWNKATESGADKAGNSGSGSTVSINSGGTIGDRLLTIQVFTAQEWTDSPNKDYIEIGDYGESVYAVNIPNETKNIKGIAMSLNKLPQYFVMTNK